MLLYLVALVGFGFLLFRTGEIAISEIQQLGSTVSVQDEWRLPVWLQGSSFQSTGFQASTPQQALRSRYGQPGTACAAGLLGISRGIGSLVSAGIVILFLSIYWSINQIHFERFWLSLLPVGPAQAGPWHLADRRDGHRRIHSRPGNPESSHRVALGLGYWLLGSPYPALLGVGWRPGLLIPMVGVALAVIAVLLMGLLTSVQLSLFTVLFTLVVLITLEVWVKPKLFNRSGIILF